MSDQGPDCRDAYAGDSRGLRVGDDLLCGHGEGCGDDSVSPLGFLDDPELPGLSNRHRKEAGQAASENTEVRLRDRDDVLPSLVRAGAQEGAEKLRKVINLSLDRGQYGSEEAWLSAHRVVSSAAASMLSLQLRVDETSLRARQFDRFAELLSLIAEEEKLRPLKTLEMAARGEADQT